jgi:hypothetical protein
LTSPLLFRARAALFPWNLSHRARVVISCTGFAWAMLHVWAGGIILGAREYDARLLASLVLNLALGIGAMQLMPKRCVCGHSRKECGA